MSGDVMFRRLGYFLSPQLDIYKHIAGIAAGLDVLDVGFGTGFGLLQLWTARSLTGIEVDPDAIRFAESYLPGARWLWGDVQRPLNYLTNPVDLVIMIEVLEHIMDWKAALKNVSDCLKPGGRMIISARNANADLRKNDLHEREWTAEELCKSVIPYFESVELFDYPLQNPQTFSTRITPVVAIATKK